MTVAVAADAAANPNNSLTVRPLTRPSLLRTIKCPREKRREDGRGESDQKGNNDKTRRRGVGIEPTTHAREKWTKTKGKMVTNDSRRATAVRCCCFCCCCCCEYGKERKTLSSLQVGSQCDGRRLRLRLRRQRPKQNWSLSDRSFDLLHESCILHQAVCNKCYDRKRQ